MRQGLDNFTHVMGPFRMMIRRVTLWISHVSLAFAAACTSIPDGQEGPAAEKRLDDMLEAVNVRAWEENTAAISFQFRDKHRIFYDKKRGLMEASWGSGADERRVQWDKDWKRVEVRAAGKVVPAGADREDAVKKAAAAFVNDVYWFCPLFQLRSPGAKRMLLPDNSLRVTFMSGGITPGDSYVFRAGDDNVLSEMNMWVSALKYYPGGKATFTDYVTTETGLKIAKTHKLFGGLVNVTLSEIKTYPEYPGKGEEDRFAGILAK